MTRTPSAPKYARAKAASEQFQISESTLWQWAKDRPGFPQPIKAGPRTTLFELNSIDAYLKKAQSEYQPNKVMRRAAA